jgi:phosphatidylglycerophosphate synthase
MKYHTQYIKLFYRWASDMALPLFLKFNISANQISFSRIFLVIFGSFFILYDDLIYKFLTFFFIFLFSFADALDGTVAAVKKKTFLGLWLDPLFDRLGILIIFLCISIKFSANSVYVIIIFLTLFFYIIRSLIGTDIRNKNKFSKFKEYQQKEIEKKLSNNEAVEEEIITLKNFKKKNFNMKNIFKFLFHQFAPHTHNIFLYIIFFNLFSLLQEGIILLFFMNLFYYFYEVYKITNIAITLDREI